MLRPHLVIALWACLAAPMSIWAQSRTDDALGSICSSGAASLRALQADPLLSNFFEVTCGKSIEAAIGSPPPLASPSTQKAVPRGEDNSPVISAPAPQAPEIQIDSRLSAPKALPPQLMERPSAASDSPMFRRIELQGVTVATPDEIQPLLQGFVGKPITLESLDQLTQAIQTWYRAQGWLARTLLPSQDLTNGLVLVTVVESRFTGVTIDDPKGLLRNTQVPKRLLESKQPVGEALNLNALEEAASGLRDLSGVQTSVQLIPAQNPGETAAVIGVSEGKSADVRISADNHGSRSTGEERLAANLRFNNLSRRGDSLSANLLKSDGLDYVGLGYEVPFTADGWRLEARAAHSNYHLGDVFEDADMRGPTQNLGIGLVIPVLRNSRHSVNFQTTLDSNRYENTALGNVLSKYETNMFGVQLDGQHTDASARGQTQWLLQFIRGELDLSDSPADFQNTDSSTTQTQGYFNKARASLTRRDWINTRNILTASVQGQWANKNLDGSEKFYLGGARGVRAYPVNEAGGSLGHLSSLEWETLLHQGQLGRWSLAGFYDHGKVRLYEDTSRINLLKPNEYVLHGYGLWLGTQAKLLGGTLGLRLTVAQRIGDNPGAGTDGLDSDGKRTLNRIRFDANVTF